MPGKSSIISDPRGMMDRLSGAEASETQRAAAAAKAVQSDAELRANATASAILAARECPDDIVALGQRHGIPMLTEVVWKAGFMAALRMIELERQAAGDAP